MLSQEDMSLEDMAALEMAGSAPGSPVLLPSCLSCSCQLTRSALSLPTHLLVEASCCR